MTPSNLLFKLLSIKLAARELSMNPKLPMPKIIMNIAFVRPRYPTMGVSPYPTVVIVCIVHHKLVNNECMPDPGRFRSIKYSEKVEYIMTMIEAEAAAPIPLFRIFLTRLNRTGSNI